MPRSYDAFYARKKEYLSELVDDEGEISPSNKRAIEKLCDAFDEDRPTTDRPRWPDAPSHLRKYRSVGTLANWMYYLTEYARRTDLLDTDAYELNQIAEDWLHGDDPHKDDPISKGTIRAYQNSLRMFYRYHDDVGVSWEDIAVFDQNDSSIDPRDMLTSEEIAQIREIPDHPRDQAILDLLLYTGLRNNGLRTLRIKDVDVDNGEWYFNAEEENLKDIYRKKAPRPLLGAVASVREWLDYHPSDDPEAYLIIGKPKYGKTNLYEPVSDRTIERVTESIKEEAGITKPLHPHSLRHNFTTLCVRQYGLDASTVKFLLGHSPDSTVMETTYQHLTGEDHMEKARVAAGLEQEEEDSPLTPNFCDVCDEPLGPNDKACSRCGTQYTPDSYGVEQKIEDMLYEGKGEATEEGETNIDELREMFKKHPKVTMQMIQDDEELLEEIVGDSFSFE